RRVGVACSKRRVPMGTWIRVKKTREATVRRRGGVREIVAVTVGALLGGLIASAPLPARAQQEGGPFILRLGVGTDITLGTAYGIGGRFTTMGGGRTATEFGADFYV